MELNIIDNAGLEVDGIFGPLTQQAVKRFQSENLLDPDGVVGPRTKAMLDMENSVATPSPGPPLDPGAAEAQGKSLWKCVNEATVEKVNR